MLNIVLDNRLNSRKVESECLVFSLMEHCACQFIVYRLTLVGNAMHTTHPLAGQGVDLGFMNVTELVVELKRLHRQGEDIGQYIYLCRYERSRRHSAALMLAGMQGFRDLFSRVNPAKRLLRSTDLKLVDTLPGIKLQLIRRTIGSDGLSEWLRWISLFYCLFDTHHTFISWFSRREILFVRNKLISSAISHYIF